MPLILSSGGVDSTTLLWDILKNSERYLDSKEENIVSLHIMYDNPAGKAGYRGCPYHRFIRIGDMFFGHSLSGQSSIQT